MRATREPVRTGARYIWKKLEQDVLNVLQGHLMDPELCEVFCEEYTRQMNRLRMEHNAALESHRREHSRTKKQLSQMVDAIADGAPVAPMKDKMHALENRRIELEALLDVAEEAPPLLHPNMARRYHEQVGRLIETLNILEHRAEAVEVIRSLVEKIVLSPDESENRLVANLHGDLAGILAVSVDKKTFADLDGPAIRRHKEALGLLDETQSPYYYEKKDKLVAGVGFEPTTFRL